MFTDTRDMICNGFNSFMYKGIVYKILFAKDGVATAKSKEGKVVSLKEEDIVKLPMMKSF